MVDIIQILDKANDEVSSAFRSYCIENGLTAKAVSVTAKAKGVKSFLVVNLFNESDFENHPNGGEKSAKGSKRSRRGIEKAKVLKRRKIVGKRRGKV